MRTHRKTTHNHTPNVAPDLTSEGLCEVAIAHGRYTVAIHLTSCQMWVIDSTGQDQARGPFLASRQAWAEALDLNTHAARWPTPTTYLYREAVTRPELDQQPHR
jgi:hypothetical protein